MKEVTYNLNDVIAKLSVKLSKLEIQLAHEQAAKEAYMKRVKELEVKLKEQEEEENAE